MERNGPTGPFDRFAAAFLAVEHGHDHLDLAALGFHLPGALDDRAARSDHVVKEGDPRPGAEIALNHLPRPVPFLFLADDERRQRPLFQELSTAIAETIGSAPIE